MFTPNFLALMEWVFCKIVWSNLVFFNQIKVSDRFRSNRSLGLPLKNNIRLNLVKLLDSVISKQLCNNERCSRSWKYCFLSLNTESHFQSHLFTWTSYFLSTQVLFFLFAENNSEPGWVSQSLKRCCRNEISNHSFGFCRSLDCCRKANMWTC